MRVWRKPAWQFQSCMAVEMIDGKWALVYDYHRGEDHGAADAGAACQERLST